MLALSRKPGEVVMVGDAAVIVMEVQGGQVKLGFQFPREVRIVRADLVEPNEAARYCAVAYSGREERKEQRRAEHWSRRGDGRARH